MKWRELDPDVGLVEALDRADASGTRDVALRTTGSILKTQWSSRFADACALMVANEMRRHTVFNRLTVLPDPEGTNEPPTFVAGGKKKKVDVIAASLVSGLQVGVSLKGMNFRDPRARNFDKNLTGRTYELQDELRVIHGYQAAAFIVALYFMPIASTSDKRSTTGTASFARVVEHLRARSGRTDPSLASQLDRADMAVIALYAPGDAEDSGGTKSFDPLSRGVVRYFDVRRDPPRRGRPKVETTMDLREFVDLIASMYRGAGETERIDWTDPEGDE